MKTHTWYPPLESTPHYKHRTWLGTVCKMALSLAIVVLVLSGTVNIIAQVKSHAISIDSAYLQGMTAGAQTCGSKL